VEAGAGISRAFFWCFNDLDLPSRDRSSNRSATGTVGSGTASADGNAHEDGGTAAGGARVYGAMNHGFGTAATSATKTNSGGSGTVAVVRTQSRGVAACSAVDSCPPRSPCDVVGVAGFAERGSRRSHQQVFCAPMRLMTPLLSAPNG
jgi:hypothetical protein